MCFILHMASKSPASIVPWDEAVRGVWTESAKEHDIGSLRSKLTLEHITYVGSSNYCGCGCRHATFQQEEWYAEDRGYDGSDELADHAALAAFLEQHFTLDGVVELLGVWEGSLNQKIEHRYSSPIGQITDPKFHFRDRGLYTVELVSEGVAVP